MSNHDFVKGECQHCSGHLEFAPDAAGETIPCPHCGQPTELIIATSPGNKSHQARIWVTIGALAGGLAVAAAIYFGRLKLNQNKAFAGDSPSSTQAASSTNAPATNQMAVIHPKPKQLPLVATNDFDIMSFKLEKTAGSSLVYVIGSVKNPTANQRFGVKIDFGLLDTNDAPIGVASDYQQLLEPHAEWRFKALVMQSKAVSAKFNSIIEDK